MPRVVYQFGLPRSGLYAVAEWYLDGLGGTASQRVGGGFKDVYAQLDPRATHFVTIEGLTIERVREALAHCASRGAETWVQLRDPYNWFASLCRGVRGGAIAWRPAAPLELWKGYARHCLSNGFWLAYNRWFSDSDYRRHLAERFGFRRRCGGQPWQHVPSRGGGSSFDGRRFTNRAQEMAVLNRYAGFVDDAEWRGHFDDEVVALACELFGMQRPW